MKVAERTFDLTTHIRDPKTKLVVKKNLYTLRVQKGMQLFERPVGSGNCWYLSDEPAGRWVNGKHLKDAKHVAFKLPETQDEKLAREMIAVKTRNKMLEAELEAIKREQEPVAKPSGLRGEVIGKAQG